MRRNTAPAIALSALAASEDAPDAVLAVLPSDQAVRDEAAFLAALRAAAEAARTHDAFVTLGIPPTRPETGFGYMEVEERRREEEISSKGKRGEQRARPGASCASWRSRTLARAEEFVASGRFFWNAGIFVFRTSLLFEEMEQSLPRILDVARRAHAARKARRFSPPSTEIFSSSPSVSIDVAVMEKARQRPHRPLRVRLERPRLVGGRLRVPGRRVRRERARGRRPPRWTAPATSFSPEARPVRVVGLSDVAVVDVAGRPSRHAPGRVRRAPRGASRRASR